MTDKAKSLKAAPQRAASAVPAAPASIATAIKALHTGQASPHQQQIAMQWIVLEACGKGQFPYHTSDRDTVFALGRLFVAELIVGLVKADLSSIRQAEEG
jgi:hypothetical protein